MITDLKRWERVSYPLADGGEITMELRRLRRHEAKPLRAALLTVFRQMEKASGDDLTNSEKAEILNAMYEAVGDEQIRQWFTQWVRNVGNLAVDGGAIVTGEALFTEVADDELIGYVLLKLADLSRLSAAEGKGSASPSTSSPAPVLESSSSGSAAPSTGSEACTEPSTATETPLEQPSSSAPVAEA